VLGIEIWPICGGSIFESHIGNSACVLMEVSNQIRTGNTAAEREDSDALSSSGKVLRKMVTIRDLFERGQGRKPEACFVQSSRQGLF
jgi:hypothetical protein